jgi:hypothetical protein
MTIFLYWIVGCAVMVISIATLFALYEATRSMWGAWVRRRRTRALLKHWAKVDEERGMEEVVRRVK